MKAVVVFFCAVAFLDVARNARQHKVLPGRATAQASWHNMIECKLVLLVLFAAVLACDLISFEDVSP